MDKLILDSIYEFRNPILDKLMVFITNLGTAGVIFIIIGLVFFIKKSTRKIGLTILVSLVFCLIFGNFILKPLIARPRPYNFAEVNILVRELKDFSFPSGHTYSAFATAFSIFFYNKKNSILFFVFAFIMAFSRLYLYVHYPSDILGGIFLGLFSAILGYKLVENLRITKGLGI
ncbi:MAG: phosphatase PAP2 family protein [Peptoniphilaceae bacterium]